MAIYKITVRGKTRYLVRYRDVHSRAKQSKRFDTRDEAEQFEAALVLAKHGGVRVKRQSTQTLRGFWGEYVEKFGRHDLAVATLDNRKQEWAKWIEPVLGNVPLATLASSPELVQGLKLKMIEAGAGKPTQKKVLDVLSALLGKAVELQRIGTNPCNVIRKPSTQTKEAAIPSGEAVKALLAAIRSYTDRRLAALIAYAALRPQEALAIHTSDIRTKSISITKAIKLDGVGVTKTRRNRIVPIRDELRPFLEGLPEGPLFIGERKGSQWSNSDYRNWRSRKFQAACVAVGLGVITRTDDGRSYAGLVPYDLRHYAGSTWLHEGNDPVLVARWMGHSLAVFLNIYAHVTAELGLDDEDDGSQLGPNAAPEPRSAQ